MKYLKFNERPSIEPTRLEAIAWFYKDCSIYLNAETEEVTVTDFGEDKRPEDWKEPTEEDIVEVYETMLQEWKTEWPIIAHNNAVVSSNINNLLFKLFNDIESDIIPGKDGEFYSFLKQNLK